MTHHIGSLPRRALRLEHMNGTSLRFFHQTPSTYGPSLSHHHFFSINVPAQLKPNHMTTHIFTMLTLTIFAILNLLVISANGAPVIIPCEPDRLPGQSENTKTRFAAIEDKHRLIPELYQSVTSILTLWAASNENHSSQEASGAPTSNCNGYLPLIRAVRMIIISNAAPSSKLLCAVLAFC